MDEPLMFMIGAISGGTITFLATMFFVWDRITEEQKIMEAALRKIMNGDPEPKELATSTLFQVGASIQTY